MGRPSIFRKISGINHVYLHGNSPFFDREDVVHYINKIEEAKDRIQIIRRAAESSNGKNFCTLRLQNRQFNK